MYKNRSFKQLICVGLLFAFLTACKGPAPSPEKEAAGLTPTRLILPTETLQSSATTTATPPLPTDTLIPSQTATLVPTETPEPTETPTLTPTQGVTEMVFGYGNTVLIYFIQLDTGGVIGCGDSAIGVGSGATSSGDIAKDLKAALAKLFTYKTKMVAGLYNPLYASRIKVDSVKFENGLATVDLNGTYKPSGNDCDSLRVKAQIWLTVRQFPAVTATNIYLNGIPFGDRVSND